MKVIIPRNWHYAVNILPGIWIGKVEYTREIVFDDSIKTNLPPDCVTDWNKLIGVSGGWNHHQDSIRVVWRYNKGKNNIELGGYRYVDGVRLPVTDVISVSINTPVLIRVQVAHQKAKICLSTENIFGQWKYDFAHRWGLTLVPYHGGNCPAPQTIRIAWKSVQPSQSQSDCGLRGLL